jgi:hypothetical protein
VLRQTCYIRVGRETTFIVVLLFPEYRQYLQTDGTMVCLVCKSLYGLIESEWLWYKEITSTLATANFHVTDTDKGVVYKMSNCDQTLFASLNVDDIEASASRRRDTAYDIEDEFFAALNSKYPGTAVQQGPKYRHLAYGIDYDMTGGTMQESQTTFIEELLMDNKVVGKERNSARADLMTSRKFENSLTEVEHSQFRLYCKASVTSTLDVT